MAGGAETPNIAALPAIARLGACESARGPDADRHVKLLSQFAVEGSLSGAYSQAPRLFAHAWKLRFEGIISKKADAPYRSERSDAWVKIKCMERANFPVVGFVKDPTGSRHFTSVGRSVGN
jgi:hypothetical protein